MPEYVRLTKSEEQMMDIFWSSDHALTSVDIVNMKVKSTWINGLVHNMIRSLLKKGLLKECGIERYKTQYARKLCPAYTKEEFIANQITSRLKGENILCKLLSVFFHRETDKEQMITDLEEAIRKFREEVAEKRK